jgi:DNA-binding XRE family transcriptional regulator
MNPATGTNPSAAVEHESPYVRLVREIQGSALTQDEIARIVHANKRSVQHWVAGNNKPSARSRDALLELKFLCDRLRSFMAPAAIEIFWHARSAWLDGERPIDVLEAGDFERVLRTIATMANTEY